MAISVILTDGPDLWTPLVPGPSPTEEVLLTALSGDDTVEGTSFDDTLYGGPGNDLISPGAGNDSVFGNLGDDTIRGTSGDNVLIGNEGNDYIIGGTGNDIIFGNEDNDTIRLISSNALVYGGQGDDTIYVQFSDNIVYSNLANDTIIVQGTNTFVHGGDGDDTITLEVASPATLIGGKASDTFEFIAGVATADLVIKGGGGAEGEAPPEVGEMNKILVTGDNNFSGADISVIGEIEVVPGVTGEFDATIFDGTLNGPDSFTVFSGGGTVKLLGTSAAVTASLQHIEVAAGTSLVDEGGNPVIPLTTALSRDLYDLPSDLTEFFVIDGAQFIGFSTDDFPPALGLPDITITDENLDLSIVVLAIQFGVITLTDIQGIAALPGDFPTTIAELQEVAPEVGAKLVAFGDDLNDPKYIPQVTQGQYENLIDEFYDKINPPGDDFTPVNVRFLSVIDTQDTADTADDVTNLYHSPTGDFSTGSTDNSIILSYNIPGFTPSNPLNVGAVLAGTTLSLDTIDPSSQLVPVA